MSTLDIVCEGFTGANCRLGNAALVSLSVNESLFADFDTASALCIGPTVYEEMDEVDTYEGGVNTGTWIVEEVRFLKSSTETRYRDGHKQLVSYKLKRKGWNKLRATTSRSNMDRIQYPLRFMAEWYKQELMKKWWQDTPLIQRSHYWEHPHVGWIVVPEGNDILNWIASLFNITINHHGLCNMLPKQYTPTDQPVMNVIKEVASWSACNAYLKRDGTVEIYKPSSLHRNFWNGLRHEVRRETIHAVPNHTFNRIIGSFYPSVYYGVDGDLAWWSERRKPEVIEDLTNVYAHTGTKYGSWDVEKRREIKDYQIYPHQAAYMAQMELEYALLQSNYVHVQGVAEGYTGLYPLYNGITEVQRTLTWTQGGYYTYEIDFKYANVKTPVYVKYPVLPTYDDNPSVVDYITDHRQDFPDDASMDDWWEGTYMHSRSGQSWQDILDEYGY